ncbi:MAG TPA: type VI secretion system protein TssA [Luteibacter sp.]|uniref:type VI secretion system protein TssA n=1 Tax=Luteibacter sp. TaxID=1886636 RepID=UPI002C3D3F42|nr:type VI secretion system protein TssA [Luteibacter sp.]HVI55671.1 type VI secretion system protein TssA [Luteibacter sp.]
MPTSPLIEPIPGADPGGIDLTFRSEFDAIQEARRADDPSLDQGEWSRDLKTADWPLVARLCRDALSKQTKDLRVAGWYLEARTHIDGLPGLAEGYHVVASLCEHRWAELHPRGEDSEERLGCLHWLVGQSPRWIRTAPLVRHDDISLGTMSTIVERDPDRKRDATAKVAAWREAIPASARDESVGAVDIALAALDQLEQAVDRYAPGEGPSLTTVREALRDVVIAIEWPLAGNAPRETHTTGATGSSPRLPLDNEADAIPPSASPVNRGDGPHRIDSREKALDCLREVAQFFRQTEPHSPVAYLAEKAARWGEMPLHEWLHRVLGDGDALTRLRDVLDVRGNQATK